MSKADDLQRRAEASADLSIKFVRELPDHPIAKRLGTQFLDASTSVAANYRAARRGKSHDDFTAKLGTVSEEADEAQQPAKIFGASVRTARSRRGRRRPEDPPPR